MFLFQDSQSLHDYREHQPFAQPILTEEQKEKVVELRNLACTKGVYPYAYSSLSRMTERQLPPIDCFFNDLTDQPLSNQEYEHAQTVWQAFKVTNFLNYHLLYLISDVLILSDLLLHFQKQIKNTHGLEPLKFVTLPSLTMQAALKESETALELFTDIDMYLFCESALRGGLVQANIKLADQKTDSPTSTMLYFDVNIKTECLTNFIENTKFY